MNLNPLYKGTDKIYKLTFLKDGAAVDISGGTVYFTVKSNTNDAIEVISKTVTNHTGINTTEISISKLDTVNLESNDYVYDIIYKDTLNKETVVSIGGLPIISKVKNG